MCVRSRERSQIAEGDGRVNKRTHRPTARQNHLRVCHLQMATTGTANASGVARATPATPHPRAIGESDRRAVHPSIFVYDLPHVLLTGEVLRWSHGFELRSPGCEAKPKNSQEERDCVFGPSISVYSSTTDRHIRLRASGTFSLGRIMQHRLASSSHRVEEPEHADVFFVPIWRESLMANPTLLATCPSAEKIVSLLPFLTEETAPRHLIISGRTGIIGRSNMVTNRGYDVCPALQDGLPGQRQGGKITAAGLLSMMTRVATEDVTCCAGHWGHWAKFSVPCPNVGSGLDIDETLALRAAAHSQLPRSVLAMGSFGMHGKQAHLRASWRAECINLPDECDFVDLGCLPNSQSATWLCAANSSGVVPKDPLTGWKRISSARLNATFCLEPFGDSPTRKSVSDTLLLGCIPVLSHEDQTKVWPWHTGSQWREFSVVYPKPTGLISFLRSISSERVARLKRGVKRVSLHLGYAPEDGRSDAVESLILGAYRAMPARRPHEGAARPTDYVYMSQNMTTRR